MKGVSFESQGFDFGIGNFYALGVRVRINGGLNAKTLLCFRCPNQVDDRLYTDQRLTTPVLADL